VSVDAHVPAAVVARPADGDVVHADDDEKRDQIVKPVPGFWGKDANL
jgi:hypothetical protein